MTRLVWFVISLAAATAAGCNRSDAKTELPPAAGSGVPKPEIPTVRSLMKDGPDAGASEDSRALAGTGTLYPRQSAELGPKMTGVLSAILVEEGDVVKKGQVLFRLDAAQASLGVQQARALLESAQVGLRATELDHRRTKELFERGSVAPAVFDQVQARYDTAKNAVAQAEVALSMAQKAGADTVVRSPIDGVVTDKLKNVGETVTMMPATTVLVVQDVSVLELRVRLRERALSSLAPGTAMLMRIPALGIERKVAVKRINPAVDIVTRTVEVLADVANTDGALRAGMLAEVSLGAAEPAAPAGSATAAAGTAATAPAASSARRNAP